MKDVWKVMLHVESIVEGEHEEEAEEGRDFVPGGVGVGGG